jgi:hypothetical protein
MIVIILLAVPTAAVAEVMDKEPSLAHMWVFAAIASAIAFVACRWNPWLVLACAPIPLLYLVSFVLEVTDSHVGPAIVAEAGLSYGVLGGGAFLMIAVAHILGIVMWRRRHLTGRSRDGRRKRPPLSFDVRLQE